MPLIIEVSQIPPITRALLAATLLATVAQHLGFAETHELVFSWPHVWQRGEVRAASGWLVPLSSSARHQAASCTIVSPSTPVLLVLFHPHPLVPTPRTPTQWWRLLTCHLVYPSSLSLLFSSLSFAQFGARLENNTFRTDPAGALPRAPSLAPLRSCLHPACL